MISNLHPIPFNSRQLNLHNVAGVVGAAGPPPGACGVGTPGVGGRNPVGSGGIN